MRTSSSVSAVSPDSPSRRSGQADARGWLISETDCAPNPPHEIRTSGQINAYSSPATPSPRAPRTVGKCVSETDATVAADGASPRRVGARSNAGLAGIFGEKHADAGPGIDDKPIRFGPVDRRLDEEHAFIDAQRNRVASGPGYESQ